MFLIFSPDKQFWKKNVNYIFAGQWCTSLKYISKNREKLRYLKYHWSNQNKFDNDVIKLDEIYEKYLTCLFKELNSIHSIKYSKNYWRIIIGPWLKSFIDTLYDRFLFIKTASKDKTINQTWITSEKLSPEFLGHNFNHNSTNDILFSEILRFTNLIPYAEKNIIPNETKENSSVSFLRHFKKSPILLARQIYYVVLDRVLPQFFYFMNNDIAIGGDIFLNRIDRIKLQLKCKSFFSIINGKKVSPKYEYDLNLRKKINLLESNDIFNKLLNKLLVESLPTVFLENYKFYNEIVLKNTPSKAKICYTAEHFHYIYFFKFWSAYQIETNNMKLIQIQHGGNYCTYKHKFFDKHILDCAYKYITWGASLSNSKAKKMPSLRLHKFINKIKFNDNFGSIMWVHTGVAKYTTTAENQYVGINMMNYFKDQKLFYSILNNNVKKLLISRHFINTWEDTKRIKEFAPNIKLQIVRKSEKLGKKNNFFLDLKLSRISIHTANQTTFLETLSANYPTLIFWDPNLNQIRDEQKYLFDILIDAEILHLNPKTAALKLNSVYNDIESWWNSKKVQKARNLFCTELAYTNSDYLNIWKKEIQQELKM